MPLREDDSMDDLVEFLRARLDEDEADAAAASPGPWHVNAEQDEVLAADGITVADGFALSNQQLRATACHIARHDPARVLREVEAKRQVLKLHERATLRAGGGAKYFDTTTVCRSCEPSYQFPELSWPCTTLRLFALPYADHPEYRDDWRP
jgi:hypothetical protein